MKPTGLMHLMKCRSIRPTGHHQHTVDQQVKFFLQYLFQFFMKQDKLCSVFKHMSPYLTTDMTAVTGCKDDFEADCPDQSC